MDRCMKVEHARYIGRMHWLGFNTGNVTSERNPGAKRPSKSYNGGYRTQSKPLILCPCVWGPWSALPRPERLGLVMK